MRKLIVFNQITLDGYFAGVNGDLSWAHKDRQDAEWNAFVAQQNVVVKEVETGDFPENDVRVALLPQNSA